MFTEVTHDLTSRGKFVHANKLGDHFHDGQELYKSYFNYDKGIAQHYSKGGKTLLNFTEKFHLNQLILDVDRKDQDWDTFINKVRNLANRLMSEYDLEDQFQLWFSGSGFHFHIPNIFGFIPSPQLPRIVRETIVTRFPEVDPKPIHARGLIRVGHSINLKTSLYKIPIAEHEIWFLTEEQTRQWGSENRKIPIIRPKGWKTFPEQICIPVTKKTEDQIATMKPNRVVTCMQNVLNAGPVTGTRHERLLRVVSWLKRNGMPAKSALAVVNDYVGETKPEFIKLVNDVYQKDYEYSCTDSVMHQFCSDVCIFNDKKNYLPEISSANDIEKSFAQYIQSGWKKNAINLAPILGLKSIKEWWVQPEDVVGIIGGTGLNKTALAQNIAVQLQDFKPLLYISTEFSNNLLGRRFAQIAHNMSLNQVVQYYEDGRYAEEALSDAYTHIKFTNATPTFQELEDLIKKYKPRVVMIDVIDDIISKNKRDTACESEVGQGIKDLGRKYKHFTIYVHHITKSAAFDEKGNPKRLNIHSGKGSSTIDQKSDIVFGIEGHQNGTTRTVRSLKGRDNIPIEIEYEVDMKTFTFERITDSSIIEAVAPDKPKLSGKKE